MLDDRGKANSGLVVLVVVLLIAIVAVLWLWRDAEDDAELEVDIGHLPVGVELVSRLPAGAPGPGPASFGA